MKSLPLRRPALAIPALAVLLLAACGGGSPTEPSPGSSSLLSVEGGSFLLINQARRGEGEPELLLDSELTEIARLYSQRMRDEHFFDHTDPQGAGVTNRLGTAGIHFRAAGENLAFVARSNDSAGAAHRLLMSNPEHRSNILNRRFTEVGVGASSDGDTVWITQIFIEP